MLGLSVLIIAIFIANGAHAEGNWSGERQVTNAERYAGAPAVGIDGKDNTYLVFEQGAGFFNESREIHFMKISPGGEVLVNRTIASAYALDSTWPDIAVEKDGTSHIVYQDTTFRNIYYMELDSNGRTVIPGVPIASPLIQAYTPSIAVDNEGRVHIVYLGLGIDDDGQAQGIYYTELDPHRADKRAGTVTDADIRLIDDTKISSGLKIINIITLLDYLTGYTVLEYPPLPDVAVDSHRYVHVVWTDGRDGNPEIYYSKLDPSLCAENGTKANRTRISIVDNARLTTDASMSLQPGIAVGPDDEVKVAFTDNLSKSFEVYYSNIGPIGLSGTPVRVSDENTAPSGLTKITIDREGNTYITWRDRRTGHFEVYLSAIDPEGNAFIDNLQISHCSTTAGGAPIAVDFNLNPIIFWEDNRTFDFQIYYNRTLNFPDLSVEGVRTNAIAGLQSDIFVTLKNSGNRDAETGVRVVTGNYNQSTTIAVPADSTKAAVFHWTPSAGRHILSISVDPENMVTESDEGNNQMVSELNVPTPTMLGIEGAEFSSGELNAQVEEGGHYSASAGITTGWLNITLQNAGGSPTGTVKLEITGMPQNLDAPALKRITPVNLSGGAEETVSFALEMEPGKWNFSIILDPEDIMNPDFKALTSLNFTVRFPSLPDPGITGITLSGERTEGKTLTIMVGLENKGEIGAGGTLILKIDGRVFESRPVFLNPGEELNESFEWKAKKGSHTIRTVLAVSPDTGQGNNERVNEVTIDRKPVLNVEPTVAAGAGVLMLGALMVGFTENGRYWFLKFMLVPLYTRLKREKILDHFLRGQVYGFIKANPGAHYNLIRKKLNINNGALAYHISVLERERFIRSRRDGTLKRFYPANMNIPKGHELTEMEKRIIDVVKANPGFSQKDIANTLGLSPQVVNYHIKSLARAHILRLGRVGKRTLCYLSEDFEPEN